MNNYQLENFICPLSCFMFLSCVLCLKYIKTNHGLKILVSFFFFNKQQQKLKVISSFQNGKRRNILELGIKQHLCRIPAVLLKPRWGSVFSKD